MGVVRVRRSRFTGDLLLFCFVFCCVFFISVSALRFDWIRLWFFLSVAFFFFFTRLLLFASSDSNCCCCCCCCCLFVVISFLWTFPSFWLVGLGWLGFFLCLGLEVFCWSCVGFLLKSFCLVFFQFFFRVLLCFTGFSKGQSISPGILLSGQIFYLILEL